MSEQSRAGGRALIVAHGQPGAPLPASNELAALAAKVGALLPGWEIASATLALEGELEARCAAWEGASPSCLIYPMFIAQGWFTRVNLPRRLERAGRGGAWQILAPFGTDPGVLPLAKALVCEAGLGPGGELLIAAHGSSRSAAPADLARRMADALGEALGLARAEAAFIDQPPRLERAQGFGPKALCLPLFAARGGHVRADLPAALAKARFPGQVLEPLGLAAQVPALIAKALLRAAQGGVA